MIAHAEPFGPAAPGQCAEATSTAMGAADMFKGLTYTFPGRLEAAAKEIRAKQPASEEATKRTLAKPDSDNGESSSSSGASSSSSLSLSSKRQTSSTESEADDF